MPHSLDSRIISFCDAGDAICGVDKRHLYSECKTTKVVHVNNWKPASRNELSVSRRVGEWVARVAAH